MDISVVHHFEQPPQTVVDALTDPDAMRAKYEALGHRDVSLVSRDVEPDGAVTVMTRRTVPLDVPGFAKKVLSPSNTVVQTDRWSAPGPDGARTGTFTVDAKGVPVKVGGSLRLTPEGAGCTFAIDAKVECKVPLIGGKIADFVGGDTRRAIEHEGSWTKGYLERA